MKKKVQKLLIVLFSVSLLFTQRMEGRAAEEYSAEYLRQVQEGIGKLNRREIQGFSVAIRHYAEGFTAPPFFVGDPSSTEIVSKDHRLNQTIRMLLQNRIVARISFEVSPAIADHGMDEPIFIVRGKYVFKIEVKHHIFSFQGSSRIGHVRITSSSTIISHFLPYQENVIN